MQIIGGSIIDAIDWAQDKLTTTRPIAEMVLFSMLADKKVRETENGFMLIEDDEDDLHRRYTHVRHARRYHRRGLTFKTSNRQLTNRYVDEDDDENSAENHPDALF